MLRIRPVLPMAAASLCLGALFSVACGGSDVTGAGDGPTTLQVSDIAVGTGAEAQVGDIVSVHYIGTFLNGDEFENSYRTGSPFSFVLGAGRVIAGWDQGLPGMRVGGKRRLVIPAELAYGAQGNGPIPPNTPLQFDVELKGIQGK